MNIKTTYKCSNCINRKICKFRTEKSETPELAKQLSSVIFGREWVEEDVSASNSPITATVDCDLYVPEPTKDMDDKYRLTVIKEGDSDGKNDSWKCKDCGEIYTEDVSAKGYPLKTCPRCGGVDYKRFNTSLENTSEFTWNCNYCGEEYNGPLNKNGSPIATCNNCGMEEFLKEGGSDE